MLQVGTSIFGVTEDDSASLKALNTVLAFCSSRKQLATTFDSIRASVEALIKE